MDIQLYAELHGLAKAVKSRGDDSVDPLFEQGLQELIELQIATMKEDFQETAAETFAQHAEKMSDRIKKALRDFFVKISSVNSPHM